MFKSIQSQTFLFRLVVGFMLATLLTVSDGLSQSNTLKTRLPNGDWSVSINPYFGADYESVPVMVYSVTSDAAKGGAITQVGIANHSVQPVAAVKFSWYLTTEQNRETVLRQGQTSLLRFRSVLPVDGKKLIIYSVTSFVEAHKPLLRNGVLNGNFRIEVAVSEVQYEDGTVWTRSETRQAAFVKAASRSVASSSTVQGCPKQQCVFDSSGRFQTCQASTFNSGCSNSANGTRCTNTICGTGGGRRRHTCT